jgi:hypothetical protein
MAKSLAAVACAVGADIRLGPVRDSRLGHGAVHNTDAASARPLSSSVAPYVSFRNRFANIERVRPTRRQPSRKLVAQTPRAQRSPGSVDPWES